MPEKPEELQHLEVPLKCIGDLEKYVVKNNSFPVLFKGELLQIPLDKTNCGSGHHLQGVYQSGDDLFILRLSESVSLRMYSLDPKTFEEKSIGYTSAACSHRKVAPVYRGRGIFSIMLERAQKRLKALGQQPELSLMVTPTAKRLTAALTFLANGYRVRKDQETELMNEIRHKTGLLENNSFLGEEVKLSKKYNFEIDLSNLETSEHDDYCAWHKIGFIHPETKKVEFFIRKIGRP